MFGALGKRGLIGFSDASEQQGFCFGEWNGMPMGFFLGPRGFEIRVPLFPLFICYGSGGLYCALEKCRGRRFILGFNVGGRKKKGVESLV